MSGRFGRPASLHFRGSQIAASHPLSCHNWCPAKTLYRRLDSLGVLKETPLKVRMMVKLVTNLLCVAAGLVVAAEAPPPSAVPVKPVTDEYFGLKIVDPYRYMEDLKNTDVQAWIKAQADYTASTIARIPRHQQLLARIHELNTAATARIANVQMLPGDVVFYEKTLANEDVAKLYVRHGMRGEEKLLFDPTRLNTAGGPPHVVTYFSPSWDGGYVVAGISEGGSEQATIHIIETATGK